MDVEADLLVEATQTQTSTMGSMIPPSEILYLKKVPKSYVIWRTRPKIQPIGPSMLNCTVWILLKTLCLLFHQGYLLCRQIRILSSVSWRNRGTGGGNWKNRRFQRGYDLFQCRCFLHRHWWRPRSLGRWWSMLMRWILLWMGSGSSSRQLSGGRVCCPCYPSAPLYNNAGFSKPRGKKNLTSYSPEFVLFWWIWRLTLFLRINKMVLNEMIIL